MHVHAKSNTDVKIPADKLKQLPKSNWGIVTTIQHEHKIQTVIDQLKGAKLAGQVLGCNASEAEKISDQIDAWLFVGSGIFHPIQVALKTNKDVWLWNPDGNELTKLDPKIAEQFRKRKQGELNKFLHAKTVGIIVSTKIGQKNLMRALELQKNKDKDYYIFACDELPMSQLENFNFIDFWVNTACPRIADEKSQMVNIDDLIEAGILKLKKEPMAYEVPIWKSSMGLKKE